MHAQSREIEFLEKLMLNASLFYPINGFDKYKMNPFFKNLTIQQLQQLLKFMENYGVDFPRESLHMFSMAQFVRRRLFAPIRPSITYNEHQIEGSYKEFLRRCSRKIGISLIPQFITRGRSNPINPQDVIRFQSTSSLQYQIFAISNYGPAFFLGNTSAIAEMCYRLSKTPMYNEDGLIYPHGMSKVILLVEYGISLGCPDCLGLMAYFRSTPIAYISDQRNVLKIAGQSAEAGSNYGWLALARLLKDNSDNASYHTEFDDGIDIDESDLGVRKLFVCKRATRDEQIRMTLEEHGCQSCLGQFFDEKDECPKCRFDLTLFNNYPDDDTSVPKSEQMRIAVEIYYKILSENPPSHPICVDSRKKLVEIYKQREWLFNGSIEATNEEIRRLEAI
jgi:hypothetical protein